MNVFELFATISIDSSGFEAGLTNAKGKFESFSKSVTSLSSDLKSAYSNVGDLFTPLIDGFKAVESVGQTAASGISTALKGFMGVATAVGAGMTSAVKSGANFDQAMSQVSATLGLTTDDIKNNVNGAGDVFDMLRKTALRFGSETNYTSKQAAEGLNILAMSGFDAYESADMLGDVLHLAAAGSMDMANAAGFISGAIKGFNDETKDSGYYADLVAKGATLANTSVSQLGESLSGSAATAKTYGQTAETTAVALLRLAEQGEVGSAASTALAAAMKNMYAPTDQARKVMQSLGVNAFDPTTGAARDFNAVVDELNVALSGYTDEQRTAYTQTIFGIQGFNAFNKMVVTSTEKVDDWAAALANATGEAARQYETMTDNLLGDLDKLSSAFEGLQIVISDSLTPMAREFAKFGAEAMNKLREGFEGSGVSGFMSALSGIVTDGVTMLAKKAPEFANVSLQFIQSLANGILDAKDAIFSSARETISMLIDGVYEWLAVNSNDLADFGWEMVVTIFQGFTGAGEVISTYIGDFIPMIADAFLSYHEALFTVGMDILGAIGRGIVENKEEIHDLVFITIENIVTSLRDNAPAIIEGGLALLEALVGAIEENLPLIVATGAEIIGRLVAGISTASPAVQAIIGTAVLPHIFKIVETVGSIGTAVGSVVEFVGKGIDTVISIGSKLMDGIQTLFGLIVANPVIAVVATIIAAVVLLWNTSEEFRNFWIGLWENLKSVVSAAVDGIVSFFGNVIDFIKGNWQSILLMIVNPFAGAFKLIYDNSEEFRNFIDGLMENVKELFRAGWEAVKGFFSDAWNAIKNAWDAATGFFGDIWDGIKDAFSAAREVIGGAFEAAWDAVKGAWDNATGFFSGILGGIQGAFSAAKEVIGGAFESAWSAVSGAWDGAVEFFGDIWGSIKDVFGDVWEKFKEIGGNIVNGIKDGITGAWTAFAGWLGEKVGGIIDIAKNLLGIHSPSTVFSEIGGNLMLGLSNGIDDKIGSVEKSAEDAASAAEAGLDGLTEYSNTTGSDAMAALESGMASKLANVVAASAKAAAQAMQAFSGFSKEFSWIGENAMSSLANAMGTGINALQNKVAGLMSSIAQAAKTALGIHSPSKVFASIGGNMALGLGEGWDDEYKAIKNKIESGLSFGTASIGLTASTNYNGQRAARNGQQGWLGGAGDTYVTINSPVAVDAVTAAREWKKTVQRMTIGYV